jgi:cytidyltransferase-like protein
MTEFTGDFSLVIGRFQPLHAGHIKLIRTVLDEGNKVCIGIRNSEIDEKNPYSVKQRERMIVREFKKELKQGKLTYVVLPDIKEVVHGRKVGWGVREIKLDKEIENISATKIRQRRKNNEA